MVTKKTREVLIHIMASLILTAELNSDNCSKDSLGNLDSTHKSMTDMCFSTIDYRSMMYAIRSVELACLHTFA